MRINLIINQGETFQTTFTVMDEDEAMDLTGYTASAQMRKHPSSNSAVSFTTTVDEDDGRIVLSLSSDASMNIEPGRYYYDCVIDNDTVRLRPFEGTVTITPGITR